MATETLEIEARLKDFISQNVDKINDSMKGLEKQSKRNSTQMSKNNKSMLKGLTSLKAGMIGLAAFAGGKFVQSFIKAGSEVEDLTTQFKTLLGSTGAAQNRIKELSKFAQTTPFQLTDLAQASKLLQQFGGTALATGDSLRMVGDAAAVTATRDIAGVAMWVGRAYDALKANRPIGEASARLQELGLISGEVRAKIEALQKQARGKEAWKVLEAQLKTNSGAMEELSKTASGLTSTIKDQLAAAMRQMLSGGAWQGYKNLLQNIVNLMNSWIDSGVFVRIGRAFQVLSGIVQMLALQIRAAFELIVAAVTKSLDFIVQHLQKVTQKFTSFAFDMVSKGGKMGEMFKPILKGAISTNNALIKFGTITSGASEQSTEALENVRKKMVEVAKAAFMKPETPDGGGGGADAGAGSGAGASGAGFMAGGDTSGIEKRIASLKQMEAATKAFRDANIASLSSEAERERMVLEAKQAEEMAMMSGNLDAQKMLQEAHNVEMLNLEQSFLEKKNEMRKANVEQGIALANNLASSLTTYLAQERAQEFQTARAKIAASNMSETAKEEAMKRAEKKNKEAAKKEKKIAIAMAIINTAAGAAKAISQGGFPAGLIFAGLIAAAGAIQIATIAKQKFAKGGAFMTNGQMDIGGATVGDNPGGRELVTVTPISSKNFKGPDIGGGMNVGDTNIVINGNVGEKEVRDIENISRNQKREIELMFRDTNIRTRLQLT